MRLGDGKTPQKLASAFQVPKATMTNTLTVLTDRELIEMRANPDDKRSKLVFMTDKGRTFYGEAMASMGPALGGLVSELPDLDMDVLLVELQKLRTFLDGNRDY